MAKSSVLYNLVWCLALWAIKAYGYTILTSDSLKAIPGPGKDFDIHNGAILAPILIPRVSGTEGNTKVMNHLVDYFRNNLPEWQITFQNSTSKTPVSGDREIPFINVIATREPPWLSAGQVSYLTLAAHYDSKFTPEGFIGGVDSAAPVAMIMHAARAVDAALTKKWTAMEKKGVVAGDFSDEDFHKGVQIIFFDGEEAFLSWTAEDSIYGARSLAEEWESTFHPALSTFHNPIDSISLMVLLDLLGAKAPRVPSYFPPTHWAYQKMADLEKRLRKEGLFKSSPNHGSKVRSSSKSKNKDGKHSKPKERAEPTWLHEPYKKHDAPWLGGLIGDDHMPFLHRGVQVLHLITSPFPRVWHTMDDNGANLDADTVEDWALLTTVFVSEWMGLEGFIGAKGAAKAPRDEL